MNLRAGIIAFSAIVALAIALRYLSAAISHRAVVNRIRPGEPSRRLSRMARTPAWMTGKLIEMGVNPALANVIWPAWLAAVAGGCTMAVFVVGPGLALFVLIVLTCLPVIAWRFTRHRGDMLLESAVAPALEGIARSLRTGASLRSAIEEAASQTTAAISDDFVRIARSSVNGLPLIEALNQWADRRQLPCVRLAVAALALGSETGGAQAQALDGVAVTIRSRLGITAEIRAQSSQARLSAAILIAMPLVFSMAASSFDQRIGALLFNSSAGLFLLMVGLGLNVLGAFWMARITRVSI